MARRSKAAPKGMLEQARRLGREAKPAREAAQRQLLLGAMAEAVAAKGYEACRVEDVLALSGLSRSSFYKSFSDKKECLLAAFEEAVNELIATMQGAAEGQAEPEARIEAGVEGLVALLAEEPAMARLALVEIRTMGPEGQARYEAASKRFASLLEKGGCLRGAHPGLEAETAGLIVGSVATVLALEVAAGRTEKLGRLAPELAAMVRL